MLLADIEAPPKVLAHIIDGVGVLTLNRPAVLNALDLATVRALTRQLTAWAGDPAIRAVLLRGTGERAFCAGGDVRSLHQLQRAGGSVGKLAKAAGMERTHLYRKLRDLGVDVKNAATEN